MPRNLDLTALRSFTAVADAGGVTRAAAQLNLTQSAVSMQLKRLEESLGLQLLDRSARRIALTAQGEQLLAYARRLLALNDEAWGRLTHPAFEGVLDFGVEDLAIRRRHPQPFLRPEGLLVEVDRPRRVVDDQMRGNRVIALWNRPYLPGRPGARGGFRRGLRLPDRLAFLCHR